MRTDELTLESLYMGGHPLIQPFLERLRLREHLEEALGPPDRRFKLNPVDSALLLIRNFILSRHPLYGVPEWARQFDPAQLEIDDGKLQLVNDDRLGRVLDRLFELDLKTLMTRMIVGMVKEFGLDLRRSHQDSTTVTFSGVYAEKPPRADGRRRVRIVHGHNKDHRPDLKQLVWSLTVSADGAVPIHYQVCDGNRTDDTLHLDTWEALRHIVGRPDFIYVADSKLCTRENMGHIDRVGGCFITMLPRTRKEDARFREHLVDHEVDWCLIWKRPPLRRKSDPAERFEAVEAPEPTVEGYRVVWYRSSQKWQRDQQARDHAIQAARQEIQRLRSIPLYPEERACRAPTADKILGLFEPLRRHRLLDGASIVKTFWDPLSEVQRLILELLDGPAADYGQ